MRTFLPSDLIPRPYPSLLPAQLRHSCYCTRIMISKKKKKITSRPRSLQRFNLPVIHPIKPWWKRDCRILNTTTIIIPILLFPLLVVLLLILLLLAPILFFFFTSITHGHLSGMICPLSALDNQSSSVGSRIRLKNSSTRSHCSISPSLPPFFSTRTILHFWPLLASGLRCGLRSHTLLRTTCTLLHTSSR